MLFVLNFGEDKWGMKGRFIGRVGPLSQPKNEGGMGFRDLRSFNLAMLGKQGWRLMHEKDSLLYKCFKARYFPRCHFLDATIPPNSSFVWRSIMTAMPLLKSGCCWRVGSGDEIRIRKDKWIPNYPSNMVLHPVAGDVEECMVADLIDPDLHCWRRDLILETFHINDAKAICNIPLSRRRGVDSVVWLLTKNGKYSVRSGYHKARKEMINESWAESSSSAEGQQIWKVLWGLKIPSKLKVFGWRACHEILPTRVNLAKRKILENVMCHCCQRFAETAVHAVWECGAAQDVWAGSITPL